MTAQIPSGAVSPRDGAPLVPNLDKNTTHSISADHYADRLMDDLFDELESSLDEGVDIPLATEELVPKEKEEEPLSLTPLQVSSVVLPPEVLPTGPRVERQEREQAIADAVRKEERDRSDNKNFDRFVISAALVSLIGSMGLWAWNQRNQAELIAAQNAENAAAQTQFDSADKEFVGYMQRSLSAIDATREAREELPTTSEILPAAVIPVPVSPVQGNLGENIGRDLPFASNLVEAIDRLSRILETLPVDEQGRPLAFQQPQPGQVAAQPAEGAEAKDGEKPADAEAAAGEGEGETADDKAIIATPQHTLVGLLELGDDRSVALFSIDGVTRRVSIGEAIGGSGWVLTEIADQEAKIRKDGEVQSLFIGQKF
ncbi:MAG: hypothetical protein AAF889_05005 [Cyanobacteria bacterium P01_D01_bin.73]